MKFFSETYADFRIIVQKQDTQVLTFDASHLQWPEWWDFPCRQIRNIDLDHCLYLKKRFFWETLARQGSEWGVMAGVARRKVSGKQSCNREQEVWVIVKDNEEITRKEWEMEEEPESGEKRKKNWNAKVTEKQAEKDIGRGKREGLKKRLEENQLSYGLCLSKAQDFIWKKKKDLQIWNNNNIYAFIISMMLLK